MNYRELYTKYPLGREQFDGEWVRLWNELGRLLEAPARGSYYSPTYMEWFEIDIPTTVAQALRNAIDLRNNTPLKMVRVTLLDGTMVKEWGAS
jgi:hypothetical protein